MDICWKNVGLVIQEGEKVLENILDTIETLFGGYYRKKGDNSGKITKWENT